uniref:UDP-N-acetylmuramate--L-alanine ligase n=1 Tax=uncultured Flavobacteriia bacterium TaxID=212695 RepID=H6RFV7_9BACT|nr:UDP-N-acetylmuramate--alanine ligase [uncultured bacterium]CCF99918.1 UDP-N-acetylmuramate--L-alanine ligase [uncultured Flavobacteriia bacterium]
MSEHIYFLGIGGIGMSALARYHAHKGNKVSGYDRYRSALCASLEQEGMQLHYEDRASALPDDIDRVVYTPAIPKSLGEFQFLEAGNIPMFKRAAELGHISNGGISMAVAGTHGKTSISCILAHLMAESSFDCQAFLGGISKNFKSNVHFSDSKHYVLEADEYDRSFLQLTPNFLLISSVDADHLDIYGNDEEIRKSFSDLIGQLKSKGNLVVNKHVKLDVLGETKCATYGLSDADFTASKITLSAGRFKFDLVHPEGTITAMSLSYPGRHNLENAIGACAMALLAGVSENELRTSLNSFSGIERRFDFQITTDSCIYIDDYAHHPTEIRAALNSIRELYPNRKLTVLFQPHLFSRTRDFAEEFGQALSEADVVFVTDIYPAREAPLAGISSQLILEKVSRSQKKLVDKDEFLEYLKSAKPELLVSMGAGDISEWVEPINKCLQIID